MCPPTRGNKGPPKLRPKPVIAKSSHNAKKCTYETLHAFKYFNGRHMLDVVIPLEPSNNVDGCYMLPC